PLASISTRRLHPCATRLRLTQPPLRSLTTGCPQPASISTRSRVALANVSHVIHLITEQLTSATPSPMAMTLLVAGLVWFGVCAIALFVVDVREHRLPNTLNALLFVGGAALLIASTLTSDSESVLADRWGMTLIGS